MKDRLVILDWDYTWPTLHTKPYTTITIPFPTSCTPHSFLTDSGRARTGTGKTLSFTLPCVERMLANRPTPTRGRGPTMLVLSPTRELARQIARVCEDLGQGLQSICIYGMDLSNDLHSPYLFWLFSGGVPYDRQEIAMSKGLDIVVGTPGRVIDHLDRVRLLHLRLPTQRTQQPTRELWLLFSSATASPCGYLHLTNWMSFHITIYQHWLLFHSHPPLTR